MANIPNTRRGNTVVAHIKLKDGGLLIPWSDFTGIRVDAYSVEQRMLAAQCAAVVNEDDATILDVTYSGDSMQYLGLCKVIVRGTYDSRKKTYDAPLVNFVADTAQATGVIVVTDPEVNVLIDVQEVSTSVLDEAIAAAIAAAEHAEDTASKSPYIDDTTGNWFVYNPVTGEYVDSGVPATGPEGPQGVSPMEFGTGENSAYLDGSGSVASGQNSVAVGTNTRASGKGSHSEGNNTEASGESSHAEGDHTNATGGKSHAEGRYTEALNTGEHAEGHYNVSISAKTRHTVGIGTANNARKNAHTITNDGKHYIPGIGGYEGTENTAAALAERQDLASVIATFVTRSVNDLANYYLKADTYTKTEVNNLIAAINQFHYEVYASLEDITDPAGNVLYLIGPTGSGADKYEEYVYSNSTFVKIGDTSIDLSGYVTITALNTALATKVNVADVVDNLTTNDATKPLSAKQGKVLDEKVSQLGQDTEKQPRIVDAFTLIGAGDNYVYKDLFNLIPERKYRVVIPTINNDDTGSGADSYLFGVVCYDANGIAHNLAVTERNATTLTEAFIKYIPSKYDFQIPSAWAGGYVRIGCRANDGDSLVFHVVDITDDSLDDRKTIFSFGREESYYGLNLYSTIDGEQLNPVLSGAIYAKYFFVLDKAARVKITNPTTYKISAYYLTSVYARTQHLLSDNGDTFFCQPGTLNIAIYKSDLSFISEQERSVIMSSIDINIRYFSDIEIESIGEGMFSKRASDFVPLANNAYMSALPSYPQPQKNDNYITYVVPNENVKYIKAHISGNGVYAGIIFWKTVIADENGRIAQIPHIINDAEDIFVGVPENTKYITISSGVSDVDFTVFYNELPQLQNGVFLDKLLNSDSSAGNIATSEYDIRRAITTSVCSLPFAGMTVKMRLPFNMEAYFWLSNATDSININQDSGFWLKDGDTYTFPSYACMFRLVVRTNPDNAAFPLPASYVRDCIDKGMLAVQYEDEEPDVIERNVSKDVQVGAIRRNLTGLMDGMNSMFVFGHISDLHGDSIRFVNFMRYMSNQGIDAVINSGDSVMYRGEDRTVFCQTITANYPTIPYLFCIGNHESLGERGATLFADNIQPLVTPNGYLKSAGTPADDCFYYRDFPAKKIRIISINYHNGGVYQGSLGQTQITWFINTLLSTPSGYGIIVTLHSPEDRIVVSAPYDVFRQKIRVVEYQEDGFYVGNRPIMQIVDAFISRTSISTSYNDNGNTVNVVADFSGITDETIEFIAYVVGHRHEDWIGYYNHATNKQLSLGVTAGTSLYGYGSNPDWANQEDLPRGGRGVYQDAFNIYAVDRTHKSIKVVRIGADITFNLAERKYMEIPYKD